MVDRRADAWYPTAAYLYVLHLDGPELAWEYLRRHPDYQRDWLRRRRRSEAARAWGLRLMEDPALDARDAHPDWFPDHDSVLQLYPDADPPPNATAFAFWHLPGHKCLLHDGKRLVLAVHWSDCCQRFALAPGLEDGMAFAYVVRAGTVPTASYRMLMAGLDKLTTASPSASGRRRPASTQLLELHTLQALDATLAGASLRETATGLFGAEVVARGWYTDGGLRSRVRRLVRRGQSLMRGGYRSLARLE